MVRCSWPGRPQAGVLEGTPLIRPRSQVLLGCLPLTGRRFPQKNVFGAVAPSQPPRLFVDCFLFSWKITSLGRILSEGLTLSQCVVSPGLLPSQGRTGPHL